LQFLTDANETEPLLDDEEDDDEEDDEDEEEDDESFDDDEDDTAAVVVVDALFLLPQPAAATARLRTANRTSTRLIELSCSRKWWRP